jgi:hypothetical protein
VLWDASAADVLFVWRGGRVRKVDLKTGQDDAEFGTGWRGIGVFGRRVVSMDREFRIRSTTLDNSSERTIFDAPKTADEIFGYGDTFSIRSLDEKSILFVGDNGRLCQSGLPNVLVEEGVRGVRIDEAASRALVWTRHKLGVLGTSATTEVETEMEGRRFQTGRNVSWVFESAVDLSDAWFVDNGSHALVLDDTVLHLVELFPGVQAVPREVFRTRNSGAIRYDHERGVVYALAREDGRLTSVQIAPPAPEPIMPEDLP